MPIFLALIIGILVFDNVEKNSNNKQKTETTTQLGTKKKPTSNELKSKTKKLESAKEEVKPVPKKIESIKQESKPALKIIEPIKQETKPAPKKIEPIKQETKSALKKIEPIKQETKPVLKEIEPTKQKVKRELSKEEVKNKDNLNQSLNSWLKLILYILGPILAVIIGKYFYNRLRNNTPQTGSSDYMRRKFKEKKPSDNTEQQLAKEETPSDNTEQQLAKEDEDNNK